MPRTDHQQSQQEPKRQRTCTESDTLQGGSAAQAGYERWLCEHGAQYSLLRFGRSDLGGVGLFAVDKIPASAELLSTPAALAISESVAARWWCSLGLSKPVPTAELEARGSGGDLIADCAAVLYCFLVVGKHADVPRATPMPPAPQFWRPYLLALPNEYSDPGWWERMPAGARCLEFVRNTTLGRQIARRQQGLRVRYQAVVDALAHAGPAGQDAASALTWERMVWAQSTVLSRAFPAALGDGPLAIVDPRDVKDYQQALLPLHDALNYCPGMPTTWRTDIERNRICFSIRRPVAEGQEALINYGTKSNEALLLHYGFTLEAGAAPESVSLEVALPTEGQNVLLRHADLSTSLKLGGEIGTASGTASEGGNDGNCPNDVGLDSMLAVMRVAAMAEEHTVQLCAASPKSVRATLQARLSDTLTEVKAHSALVRTLRHKLDAVEASIAQATSCMSESAEDELHKESCWQDASRYVRGQRDVLKQASDAAMDRFRAEIIRVATAEVADTEREDNGSTMYAQLANPAKADATVYSFAPSECISVADTRGGAVEAGEEFQRAMKHQQVQEAVDDETANLLFILGAAAQPKKPGLRWQSLWPAALSPILDERQTSGAVDECDKNDPMVLELRGIHEALFPALTNAFPDAFPAAAFTVSESVIVARPFCARAIVGVFDMAPRVHTNWLTSDGKTHLRGPLGGCTNPVSRGRASFNLAKSRQATGPGCCADRPPSQG